ncbi:trypsin-like serine peptidase [Nonomuraea sp. NPDC049714]|uniref:trypsin-like serine peptidase n=1 Tax=Nonomuraea sp. NPDC049714 TaxID=3364357 RepID=UPI00378A50BD
MTVSTPLIAAVPLVAGLLGPALIGATSEQHLGHAHESARRTTAQTAAQAATPEAAAPGTTARRPTGGDVIEHVAARGSADQQRVLDYWTPQRMADALPISLLDIVTKGDGLLSGLTGKAGLGTAPDLSNGTLSSVPLAGTSRSGDHRDDGTEQTGQTGQPEQAGQAGQPGQVGQPGRAGQPDRAGQPRHQSARPLTTTAGSRWPIGGAVTKTTGRVFLTMAGADFVCSASTVNSANRDLVVTAGHCVKDGKGEWAENWTFVPGYGISGRKPYGQWTARRMFVAGPWSRSADDSYDVGMVALNPSGGRHVADVVGTQRIAFNSARGGHAYGFGYPADPPYDGEHLVYCAGRLRDDPYGDTRDQGLGCVMTAGSSGGPWMSAFDAATGKGTITSLSSFKYSNDQRTMYGPFLGDTAKKLFLTAERA